MSRFNPQEDIDDEVIIKNISDWQISVSKSRKRLYINTVSYHPPKLDTLKPSFMFENRFLAFN